MKTHAHGFRVFVFLASSPIIGIAATILVYILEVLIDKYVCTAYLAIHIVSSWTVTAGLAVTNLMAITLLLK